MDQYVPCADTFRLTSDLDSITCIEGRVENVFLSSVTSSCCVYVRWGAHIQLFAAAIPDSCAIVVYTVVRRTNT